MSDHQLTLASDPIARKELVLDKIILPGLTLSGGDGKGSFATEAHQHSYTHAFGDPERREGLWLLNHPITATFSLPKNFAQNAHQLKLLAMMEQWPNRSIDLAILLNGHLLRRGHMLFENIATGWPANFLDLPAELLHPGTNTLTFQNHSPIGKREALFINQLEILIRPQDAPFQFELAPTLLRAAEPFQIRIRNTTGKPTTHQITGHFQLLSKVAPTPSSAVFLESEKHEEVFTFQTPSLDNAQSITFSAGNHSLRYQPDRIVHAPAPYDLLVGTDFDDDRHDETTLAILDFFHKTQMGNIIGFRPKLGRTCFVIPDQKLFCQWFDFIKSRNLHCWLEDAGKRMPWMSPALIKKYPALLASKYHEICLDVRPLAPALRDLKHAYHEFQKLIPIRRQALALPARPFWVSSCTANVLLLALSDLVDLPIAEPSTHDHIFLYSTIRRTAALHKKSWGAHIPITWYLGNAHSEDKLRRMQISLHAAHIMGAKLIYTESGLFKFVQFSQRRDAEHPISQQARTIIRNFYSYTRTQQPLPNAQPLSSLNILYGNLDSFYFFHDHTPLDTGRSSDRYLWYKWPFTDIDHAWMAARNLFRPLPANELKGYPGDTGETRFSSNPFGSVDIIPLADLNQNPLPLTLLLGRNVMTPAAHATLTRYVQNGGTLFLSLHHFNTNPNPSQPPHYNPAQIASLTGIKSKSDHPHSSFTTRHSPFHTHHLGKRGGRVICYTGQTPMGNPQVRPIIDAMLQSLAAQFRPDIHLANDASIYLQQYRLGPITQLFLLNINWKFPNHLARADLSIHGKIFPLEIPFGPPTLLYHTPTATLTASSPLTQIYNLTPRPNSLTLTVAGKNLETLTLLAHRPLKRILQGKTEIPHSPLSFRPDILQFSLNLATPQTLTLEC